MTRGDKPLLKNGRVALSSTGICCGPCGGGGGGGTGACCVAGVCSITTEAECAGLYQGDDTTCSPDPCGTGACCDGNECTETTAGLCPSEFIPGGDCSPNPCCLPDGCGYEGFRNPVDSIFYLELDIDCAGVPTYTGAIAPGALYRDFHVGIGTKCVPECVEAFPDECVSCSSFFYLEDVFGGVCSEIPEGGCNPHCSCSYAISQTVSNLITPCGAFVPPP